MVLRAIVHGQPTDFLPSGQDYFFIYSRIVDMKDTALAASANQMDRGVSNNIKLLNTPEKIF